MANAQNFMDNLFDALYVDFGGHYKEIVTDMKRITSREKISYYKSLSSKKVLTWHKKQSCYNHRPIPEIKRLGEA